ncbi:MAG TPA: ABC transporter ATP-binding protein [Alphaproteobacteria bacterium]
MAAAQSTTLSNTPTSDRPVPSTLVDISGVQLRYGGDGGTLAVDGLDMKIREGEFVAVVGPSGCGKSSLMKLVTGLVPPTAGGIIVAGREVSGPLKIVGMAFQNPTLLPWRTTFQNVMLPFEIVEAHRHNLRRDRKTYEAEVRTLLDTVGLGDFGDRFPWELSGGMQQRASLCRALIHRPLLLMLDEPFGALDAFTREELWDVLQQIWLQRSFTTILVTHDLREAVYLADTVYVMSARPGRIIAKHSNSLPRPRTLETTYLPEFTEIVHSLREKIRGESVQIKRAPAQAPTR